ncbi:hypothetical protein GTW51_02790 [Aurantimonas aggregata]|uniref:Uncharacterized protein n=1 Tax=Aurantimonas aggregata TaxID=2047720 RepID=A0A6L9MD32_9HYPH|nr:hypothetical protein [Aurantimonas aggregata]NDV85620.1 hypothetical protein [Aurantimonas aggregata]
MSLRLPAILLSLTLAAAPVFAQTAVPEDAPIPQDGVLIQEGTGVPIGDQIDTGGLPGVDFEDTDADGTVRGPGGLQNNTGAAGTDAPDTSGYNPDPIDAPLPEGEGVPLPD